MGTYLHLNKHRTQAQKKCKFTFITFYTIDTNYNMQFLAPGMKFDLNHVQHLGTIRMK